MKKQSSAPMIIAWLSVSAATVVWVHAGNLSPPMGPIMPTMKDLDLVEPRVPITALPLTISQPGSYYLAAALTGQAGSNGITVAASGVTLDLNGFTLRGGAGSLNGVFVGTGVLHTVILNGTITEWGQDGINDSSASKTTVVRCRLPCNKDDGAELGPGSSCKDSSSEDNGGDGIVMAIDGQLDGCKAAGNGGRGFSLGAAAVVRDSVACLNSGNGMEIGDGSTITHCTSDLNGGSGIVVFSSASANGSTLAGCTTAGNAAHGISAGNGSTLTACTSSGNTGDGIVAGSGCAITHCTVRRNTGDGIEVFGDGHVLGNTCDSNGVTPGDAAGIHVTSSDNRIEGNNVTDNDRGIQADTSGNLIVRNSASGNGDSYGTIVGGNDVGPIGNAATTVSPWANIAY